MRFLFVFFFLFIGILGLNGGAVQAQNQPFTFDVDSFPKQVRDRLATVKSDYAQEFGKKFYDYWNQGILKFSDKRKAIDQVNRLNQRKWLIYPDITTYLSAFMTTRHPLSKIAIDPQDFFNVTDSVVKYFDRNQAKAYLKYLEDIVPEAIVYESSGFKWRVSQREPRLVFKTPSDLEENITEVFPALQFTNTDLVFQSKQRDSTRTTVYQCRGYYNLFKRVFHGENGRYDWSRVGLNPDEVYCEMPKFNINLTIVDFEAKNVTFYYKGLIDRPLIGDFQEHITYSRDTAAALYPYFKTTKFDTTTGMLVIRNFIENVTYKGGFSLRGVTKMGSGLLVPFKTPDGQVDYKFQPAILEISNRKKQAVLKLETQEVNLNPKQMLTDKSAVTIYLPGRDSLYHQSMRLSYDVKTQDMTLLMDRNDRSSWQPILNSYAKMGMFFDAIRWNPNRDTLIFTSIIDQQHKYFAVESFDFYRKDRYNQFQGVLPVNPIGLIYRFYREYNQTELERKLRKLKKEEKAKKLEAQRQQEEDEWSTGDGWGDSESGEPHEEDGWEDEEEEDDWESEDEWGNEKPNNKPPKTNPNTPPKTPASKPNTPEEDPFQNLREEIKKSQKGRKMVRTFTLEQMLKRYNLSDKFAAFNYAMIDMDGSGFIEYRVDPETKKHYITILDQLIRWAESAANIKDHDQISIVSQVNTGNNATLNYSTKQIELLGVKSFTLSDSQLVEVRPLKQKLYLEKNRDMEFSGVLDAGKISLVSNIISCDRFKFDYTEFKIRGDSVDYLRFFPKRGTFDPKTTDKKLVEALSKLKIENVTGALYIDPPKNKSHRLFVKEYPAFDCYSNSYVYWLDSLKENKHRDAIKGAKNRQAQWIKSYRSPKSYSRDSLRFTLDPFLITNLEAFKVDSLEFYGIFKAEGILPDFRDTLKPVKDNTFGITYHFRDKPQKIYGGKGDFKNDMNMDGFALWGNGEINYLATVAKADTFVFNFDSVMAITTSFLQPEGIFNGVKFPEIKADKVEYTWYPYEDRLVLNTFGEPIKLYEGGAEFLGAVVITPKGLRGQGVINVGEVQIESDYFSFEEEGLKADDASFAVTDPEITTKRHFVAKKCSVNYTMGKDRAEFFSNEASQANYSFPNQQYKTSLGHGYYNKSTGEIVLHRQSSHAENNYFESTNPLRGKLGFNADSAYYKMSEEKLNITGVDSILVADAVIYPDSQLVRVTNSGEIEKLRSATIVANTKDRFHTFTEAAVYVTSKTNYTANADHNYVPINGQDQKVFFTDIRVGADSHTVARGVIRPDDGFFISKRIFFKDTVIARAQDKYFSYRGKVKIESNNPALRESWFEFKEDNVNPDTVVVTIGEKTLGGNSVGVHFWEDRVLYYSLFIEPKKNKSKDVDVLLGKGVLTFDPKSNEFKIGPREKIEAKVYTGNVVGYDDSLRIVTSRGLFNLNLHELGDPLTKNPFNLQMAGMWRNNQETKTIRTDVSLLVTFPDAMKDMMTFYANKIAEQTEPEEPMTIPENRLLLESLCEFILPKEDVAKKEAAMQKFVNETIPKARKISEMNLIKDLPQTIVLSGVKMAFCDTAKAFYSYSPKVGLVGVQGKSINKELNNCKIEFKIGKRLPNNTFRSDTLRMFLAFNEFEWFYFEMADFKLKVRSSNPFFEKQALEMIEKQNKKPKKEGDKKTFELALADARDKELFIEKIFPQYLFSNCGLE